MAYRKVARGPFTVQRLTEALRFDLEAGKAYWIERAPKRKHGSEAGYMRKGYKHLTVDGHDIALHRAIWAVAHGQFPDGMIDHRDGNPLNNRIDNLRPATPVQNSTNKKVQSNNTSGFRGVYFHGQNRRWQARITSSGVTRSLGLYDTPEQASAAYEAAALTIHGEYARTI